MQSLRRRYMAAQGRKLLLSKPPTNGLIAWYPFTGDATDNVGSQDLATNGSVVQLTTGRKGVADTAYEFNGGQLKRDTLDKPGLGLGVSVWVNMASQGGAFGNMIIQNRTGGLFNWQLSYSTGLGAIALTCRGATANMVTTCPKEYVPINTWTHIVCTTTGLSGGDVRVYADGVLRGSGTLTENINNVVESRLFIVGGAWDLGLVDYFGKIDDVRIYNRLLSTTDVARLYNE